MNKQYTYSFDGDYYDSDLYDTKKEAIDAEKKKLKKRNIYIFI